jgi:hypothetical protein
LDHRGGQAQAEGRPNRGRQTVAQVLMASTKDQIRVAVESAEVIGNAHQGEIHVERQMGRLGDRHRGLRRSNLLLVFGDLSLLRSGVRLRNRFLRLACLEPFELFGRLLRARSKITCTNCRTGRSSG